MLATDTHPDVKPRIEVERSRDKEWDYETRQWIELGPVYDEVAHCDRHRTRGDGWGCNDTSAFCEQCAAEVRAWRRANPIYSPGNEWTRTDEQRERDLRNEEEADK